MVSAQKHQTPSDNPPASPGGSTATGFGKVLNSIQGLQQRLDDFSVEEVSRAHAKTHSLVRELTNLQAQLSGLAKLTDVILNVNGQIASLPEDNFDLIGPDSLEKHPQLRAIVQAGKLIRMHRMLRAAQASAEASSDLQRSITNSVAPTNQTELLTNSSPASLEQITHTPATRATEIPSMAEPSEDFAAARDSKATPTYDFADLKLEEAPATAQLGKAGMAPRHAVDKQAPRQKGKTQINERLLSDLIETYGEFAISTKPPTHAELNAMPAAAAEPVASISTDLVPFVSKSVEPAFVNPTVGGELLELPAPEQEREEPVFDGLSPVFRSHGEIDRQLKSLIKDYGQVDLYSREKETFSAKTVIIAAIAGLAIAMGGVYLLKTPSVSTPVAVEATVSSETSAAEVLERSSGTRQNPKK